MGFNDGFVGIWNFNNGSMMEALEARRREVTATLFLTPQMDSLHDIACTDWDGQVTLFPSLDIPAHLKFMIENVGHTGDALCIAQGETRIATGGSEGRVVMWSIQSGAVKGASMMPLHDGHAQPVESLVFLKKRGVA